MEINDSRYDILYSLSFDFSKEQKSKKITSEIIYEAKCLFGREFSIQLKRDMNAGFKLWDSLSMCEQANWGWNNREHRKYIEWALEKIREGV